MGEPRLVSRRNHFDSAAQLVDAGMMHVPDELKHPNLAKWLLRFTEGVIRNVATAFATGAQKGIEQTAELLCDPDFYEHQREGRRKYLKQAREQQAHDEWERIQRKTCPTAQQLAEQIRWCDNQIVYHEQQMKKYREKLVELHGKQPMSIELRASRATN